jgi:hypothetical protein
MFASRPFRTTKNPLADPAGRSISEGYKIFTLTETAPLWHPMVPRMVPVMMPYLRHETANIPQRRAIVNRHLRVPSAGLV